ncbi:hypothetical protein [Pseudanabaena minima]|uniref:hypothetical protein n=1 Tax=Pseudanabaena minima TaxID=890415 RepID=UPI003DA9B547
MLLIHLGAKKWLLSVSQPLPQVSTINVGQTESLQLGSYYEVSIPPTGKDKYISTNYRLWLPNGVANIRGLIRIYRDNYLIATLQGQEYSGDDTPSPTQVVLEFREQEAKAKTVYTVSAFNAIGESTSQPVINTNS